jgi:hypothetical protein
MFPINEIRPLRCALAGWLLLAACALAENTDPEDTDPEDTDPGIELSFANAEYRELDSHLAPVRQGALTIHIASPEHLLTVHGNRLRLTEAADATLDAELEVDFEGEGTLIATIEAGAVNNRLEDHVRVPRQTIFVEGRIRLEPAARGYTVTLVERPSTVELRIESKLAGQLSSLCKVLARLPLLPIRCDGIETALSVVTVPLPEAGKQLFLDAERLSESERAYFDRLLP